MTQKRSRPLADASKGLQKDALELAHSIVNILEEKKGEDILLLDLVDVSSFTDYFVICSGASERTLRSLAEEVQRRIARQYQTKRKAVEGAASSGWMLLDFGDVVLHIFSPPIRRYYRLEELWRDGQVILHMQ